MVKTLLAGLIIGSFSAFGQPAPNTLQSMVDRVLAPDFIANPLSTTNFEPLELRLQILEDDPGLTDLGRLQSVASQLAEGYLRAGRLQEALWALRRGDLMADADFLEGRLRDKLKGRVLSESALPRGANSPKLFKVSPSLRAVAKSEIGPSGGARPRKEAFVYELDRLIGLNRVPLTVLREFPGTLKSLQVFVPGAKDSGLTYTELFDLGYGPTLDSAGEVYLIDFITAQYDRISGNSMRTRAQRLFLPDNAAILPQPPAIGGYVKTPPSPSAFHRNGGVANARILARLHSLTEAQIEELDVFLDARESWQFRVRLNMLRTEFPRAPFARLDRQISTGKRFDDYLRARKETRSRFSFGRGIDSCMRALGIGL